MNDSPNSIDDEVTALPVEGELPVDKAQPPTTEAIIARYRSSLENAKSTFKVQHDRAVQMKHDKESLRGVRKLLSRISPGDTEEDLRIQEMINENRQEYAQRSDSLAELDKGNIQVVIDGTVSDIENLIASDREWRAHAMPGEQSANPTAKKAVHAKLAELAIIAPQKAEEYRVRIYGPEKFAS